MLIQTSGQSDFNFWTFNMERRVGGYYYELWRAWPMMTWTLDSSTCSTFRSDKVCILILSKRSETHGKSYIYKSTSSTTYFHSINYSRQVRKRKTLTLSLYVITSVSTATKSAALSRHRWIMASQTWVCPVMIEHSLSSLVLATRRKLHIYLRQLNFLSW